MTRNTVGNESYSYVIENEQRATVWTVRDATADDNTVPSSTAAGTTVLGPIDIILFHKTKPKNIWKKLSTASLPKSTQIMKNGMEVLCSVIIRQKVANCREDVMVRLKEEALLRAINYKVKTSVGIEKT